MCIYVYKDSPLDSKAGPTYALAVASTQRVEEYIYIYIYIYIIMIIITTTIIMIAIMMIMIMTIGSATYEYLCLSEYYYLHKLNPC